MMKIKTIKKAIAMFSLVAVSVCTFGMNVTVAIEPGETETVATTLSAGSGSGPEWRPIVKAKWEMNGPSWNQKPTRIPNESGGIWQDDGVLNSGLGTDDDIDEPGAQFNAPGIWGADMNYTVCAVATDPNGVADIDDVYADISYPLNRPMHISMDPNEIDNPSGGCGAKIEQNTLYRLSKDQGIALFCDNIRVGGYNNLVTFNQYYNWDEICNDSTGELPQELAYVYCDDKTLTWEDPAGFYDVDAIGHDSDGPGEALENQFEYVEFTGFEIDFSSINYPNVIQGVRSQVAGDRTFDPASSAMPTVRNIGNTRLNLLVAQDDMEFDLRDDTNWNVAYDSRIGTDATHWNGLYDPFKRAGELGNPAGCDYTPMRETLDLSETEKMDFVILVEKWEYGTEYPYMGMMWLDAERADFEEIRCIY